MGRGRPSLGGTRSWGLLAHAATHSQWLQGGSEEKTSLLAEGKLLSSALREGKDSVRDRTSAREEPRKEPRKGGTAEGRNRGREEPRKGGTRKGGIAEGRNRGRKGLQNRKQQGGFPEAIRRPRGRTDSLSSYPLSAIFSISPPPNFRLLWIASRGFYFSFRVDVNVCSEPLEPVQTSAVPPEPASSSLS